MKFSLILATIDTGIEINQFINSLSRQTHKDFELVVVDQNIDERIPETLSKTQVDFPITHVSAPPGLSLARNIGIKYGNGDILAFPDDDCIYPDTLLEQVDRSLLDDMSLTGLTGKVVDFEGRDYARYSQTKGTVTILNAWERASSISMFVKTQVIRDVGGFDEELGLGAGTPWGGGEDIDLPIRIIKSGCKIFYDPEIRVLHPSPIAHGYSQLASRAFHYGAGIGRVWRKHQFPLWRVGYYLLRPLGGSILSLLTLNWPKSRYHWNAFRGRLSGYLAKPSEHW